ncbi:energy-coupling factor transport system ATP-binding protein [Caldanaerobius fijiensis DSM 17918]|uniref:Energy-coupling factor transport system ATP-binding protein n=2 Tax=Caldanaerobius TaxID=862261 RepID=A0A1M4YRY0_9THEO|nr:energy-coupling factor transporter ATPase [Caldanaerobius fijiensis]SHF08473.1 energy-coupling factor transport system ATP-binding protein [Caldanaerobius fijiensis DSM 17918]
MLNIITARDLIYRYNSMRSRDEQSENDAALNGINVDIKQGEFVTIIGHNGSGKSTLAKHFNALLLPSSGTVLVDGIDTRNGDMVWNIRQTAGMVFQNPDNQLVASVVEEDVAFGPENLGIPPQNIRERVDEALRAVGMIEYAKKAPHLLSGGQKQRVAIAGIIAMRPKCIILDEATAMLDPSGRQEVMNTVKKLNREEGITIVNITHYMDEAVDADRVIVMDHGTIVMNGTPREVFKNVELLKRLGLDVPQVTELAYLIRKDGYDIPVNILTVDEMVELICRL